MSSLGYSPWKRFLGSIAGYLVYYILNILFRLPDSILKLKFKFIKVIMSGIIGDTPETRAVSDLHYLFSKGGEGADIVRKVIILGRSEELIGIVRGNVIRSLK